jgi:protein-tyrosine-phosphatase
MKILCVCEGGNVRSVACAYLFKYRLGDDALAVSVKKNNLETHQMLWQWADRIIVMQPEFKDNIPTYHQHKVKIYDVGPDQWGNCLHPDLLEIIESHMGYDLELNYGRKGQPQ